MKNKLTLAIVAGLSASSLLVQSASVGHVNTGIDFVHSESPKQANNASMGVNKKIPLAGASFLYRDEDVQGEHLYIVHFEDSAVAQYTGNISQYSATKPLGHKLDVNSPQVRAYLSYLSEKHDAFLAQASKDVRTFKPVLSYKIAFNGIAVSATQDEASQLAMLPGVSKVVKDRRYRLDTDTGPSLIGAPAVWNGEAQDNGVGTAGEGVVVGIIDSGINTDHPSFAAVSGDGYVHINPLGAGNFLGDCAGSFSQLCNSKLIGVYSYPVITNEYADTDVFPPNLPRNGEDYGGHGTHVASTAAGNILFDVAESRPELGAQESDGIQTGFVFDRMSGVAPRANIISYQVCWGGRSDAGDTYGDCSGAAINAAIEDAIEDQVDVINYSISGGGQPWNSATELAFLSARNAGIFVATSAGNSGPDAGSTSKHAPWYTAVAASEHGRSVNYQKQINNFTGGSTSLNAISGRSLSGGITAPIVYAGDFTNPNDPGNDPAQCLEPFPAGTFTGQIVVCDRGAIARVQKAVNVRDGGAGGYVLANVTGGTDNLANDAYVVPGIHIQASSSILLRDWLASGSNHTATITPNTGDIIINPAREDVLAGFSSKGPNSSISTLTPAIGGPGVQIFAAYADQQFGHDGHEPAAGDYDYLSGTSMSSPHVAGAAALVKSANATWTPDNIRSALAMTASRTVKKEDGITAADWFDSGSGRVQVDKAVEAGLVMDESAANYTAANPNQGGDPRTLNLPSITDTQCANTCAWTRTFTATKSGTWSVNTQTISDGIQIEAQPSTFTLNVGDEQTVTVNIDVSNASSDDWLFGALLISANSQPDLHLPVSVLPTAGSIPEVLSIEAKRNADSYLIKNIQSTTQSNFRATTLGFNKAIRVNAEISQDPTADAVFDNLEQGIDLYEIDVSNESQRVVAELTQSSADDIDLFLVFDANQNNIPEQSEVIASSTTSGVVESVDTTELTSGTHWIVIQNYAASQAETPDSYTLFYAVVNDGSSDTSLSISVPSSVSGGNAFDMRASWNLGSGEIDDRYYGVVAFGNNSQLDSAGVSLVNITKGAQDVELRSTANFINVGSNTGFEIIISGTSSPENRNYDITLPIPTGFSLDANSVGQGGAVSQSDVTWNITKRTSEPGNQVLSFDLIPTSSITPADLSFALSSDVTNVQAAQVEESVLSTVIQLDSPPTVTIDGSSTAELSVVETQSVSITANAQDPNNEPLSYQWQQISGPAGSLIGATTELVNFTAPQVDAATVAVLEVTASDPQGNTDTAQVTISIQNNEAPSASISAPSSVIGGSSYTVSVTTSDPENDTVTVTIDGQVSNSLTRNAPAGPATLSFDVVISDGVNEVTETVTIAVTAAPVTVIEPAPTSGGGGGGSTGWIVLLLLPIAVLRKISSVKAQHIKSG